MEAAYGWMCGQQSVILSPLLFFFLFIPIKTYPDAFFFLFFLSSPNSSSKNPGQSKILAGIQIPKYLFCFNRSCFCFVKENNMTYLLQRKDSNEGVVLHALWPQTCKPWENVCHCDKSSNGISCYYVTYYPWIILEWVKGFVIFW